MNTGQLNKRITIVTKGALTSTQTGGFTEGAQSTVNTWCKAEQLSMTDQLRNGLETAYISYRFTIKYKSNRVTNDNELIYHTRRFKIANIENVDEANNIIVLIANEQR